MSRPAKVDGEEDYEQYGQKGCHGDTDTETGFGACGEVAFVKVRQGQGGCCRG